MSDISSLDGEEFEVIDGPFQARDDANEGSDGLDANSTDVLEPSIASEIDDSTFLAPGHEVDDRESDSHWGDHSRNLQASTSLTTLHYAEPSLVDSRASSQLRFPDPLDKSFQSEAQIPSPTIDVACGVTPGARSRENELSFPARDALTTPRVVQSTTTVPSLEQQMPSFESKEQVKEGQLSPIPSPVGIPFNWNKKLILINIFRAIVGLIVIVISTGVLPVWQGTPAVSKQEVQRCDSVPLTLASRFRGHSSACIESALTSKASKALILKPESNASSVFGSMTSFMTRPTTTPDAALDGGKRVGMTRQECNALSLYMAEVKSTHYRKCHDSRKSMTCLCLTVLAPASCYSGSVAPVETFDFSQTGEGVSRLAWNAAVEGSKLASQNAKVISTSLRKEWHLWVYEMNEYYQSLVFPILAAVSHQALVQTKASKDSWKKAWEQASPLMAYLQKAWTEWMQDVHDTLLYFTHFVHQESIKVRKDFEDGYQHARVILGQQFEQAVKGAHVAQKGVSKALQGAGDAVRSQTLRSDANAALQRVYRQLADKRERMKIAAAAIKRARSEDAARRRMKEVHMLRVKHRKMMKLVQEQNKMSHKATKLLNKGKVALYRNAIKSVKARHQVEDMLGKVTGNNPTKIPRPKKSKKAKRSKKSRNHARNKKTAPVLW